MPIPPPPVNLTSGPAISEAGDTGSFTDTGHVFNFNGASSNKVDKTLLIGGSIFALGALWLLNR